MTESTRASILEATLALVGEGGFEGLTVRAIAERAGASVSAVNYHFGTKDNAVAEAFRSVTDALEAAFAPLRDPAATPQDRLTRFVGIFAEAVHAHGRALAFFTSRLGHAPAVPASYRAFVEGPGLALVEAALRSAHPSIGARDVRVRLAQLAGALLYPELVPGALDLDFGDPAVRKAYADRAAVILLK